MQLDLINILVKQCWVDHKNEFLNEVYYECSRQVGITSALFICLYKSLLYKMQTLQWSMFVFSWSCILRSVGNIQETSVNIRLSS